MKKHLLATTAAIAVLASPIAFSPAAFAQDGEQAQQAAEMQGQNSAVFNEDTQYEADANGGFYSADPNQILASHFIGAAIYSGAGEEAEPIGDVNDVIMQPDGRAVGVIVGVGGFLGLGEKEVAVSINELQWQTEAGGGDRILVSDISREQLENAPEFDREALTEDEQMANESQGQTDQQMAESQQTSDEAEQQTAVDQQATDEESQQMAEGGQQATGEDQLVADNSSAQGEKDEMTTASTRPMETVPAAEARLEATQIVGMTVNSANDEVIGEVSEILIGEDGQVEAFVVDVGGFLGINEKPVAVAFDKLNFARAEGAEEWSTIQTGLTSEQLETSEAFSKNSYSSEPDTVTLEAPVAE